MLRPHRAHATCFTTLEGRNRQVTYLKRKAGLFKKAYELATLTDSQVAVIVFGHNGK